MAIGGIYIVLAALWIYLSDLFLSVTILSPERLLFWQTVKGLTFITITGLMIGVAMYLHLRRRESVQEALRRSEEHLTALMESARGFGLFRLAFDPERPNSARVLIASPGVADLLAISDPYSFGDWSRNVVGEDRKAVDDALEQASRDGEPYQQIFRVSRPNAERVHWIEGVGMPTSSSPDNTVCMNGLLVDITDRILLEQQLAQSQRLEAVGQLAGGIAHDFNNLLTVILGQTQLLADGLDETDPLRLGLSEVEAAAERAADLTRQLLTFSRRQIVEPRILQLNDRVAGLESMIRRLIGEAIQFSTSLAPNLHPVRIDPPQLDQVIINLCVNARDAMPKGGSLRIRTENVVLDETFARSRPGVTPGEYVLLAVTDTGVGMHKAVQARVFEPFFTTKSREKGTGLGLSTVYGIVKKAKGNVWVESAPGQGAEFKVYLPRASESGGTQKTRPPAEIREGREQVLVVEDDPAVRAIICKLLTDLGYTVRYFSAPEKALDLTEEELAAVDVLLTDVILPNLTGKDLAERLRKRRPDLRVLFASGYANDDLAQHGVLNGREVFLQKPFTRERLALKMRQTLRR